MSDKQTYHYGVFINGEQVRMTPSEFAEKSAGCQNKQPT
ncbi:hypothetical protein EDC48_112174 [Gibbsiella quercinecans]|nr:hypothetical protein EDC48_112174 [Gibbsiella quercinecans]